MHGRLRFKNKEDLILKGKKLGFDLPFSDDISPLFNPQPVAGFSISNRLVVQPMEGYDSENDGSPSELTKRRYLRYAAGGSGIIWFEAVSVSPDSRSNPHQLWLTKANSDYYAFMIDEIRKTAKENFINVH